MPVAFTLIMVVLSFPIGLLGAALVGVAWPVLSGAIGIAYQPFCDLLPYWFVLVALGYLQWFLIVPRVVEKVLRVKSGT